MKKAFLLIIFVIIPQFASAQAICSDPAGCSVASFASFQNNTGIVQFGNSTGKVFLKRQGTICNAPDCANRFALTTALVAPRGSPRSANILPDFMHVKLMAQFVTVNSKDTKALRINLGEFPDIAEVSEVKSKAKLNSGLPFSMGVGNNGMMTLSSAPNNNFKVVNQILDSAGSMFKSPVVNGIITKPIVTVTADRNLTLMILLQREDDTFIKLGLQPILQNRKKDGPAQNFVTMAPKTMDQTSTIPSIAVTPRLSRLPVVGHLFAGKSMIERGANSDLLIFVTPIIVKDSKTTSSLAPQFQFGTSVRIRNPKKTPVPAAEFFQSIAIDPLGRFLLYTEYNSVCKKSILKYQRLNANAIFNPNSGKPKIGGAKTLAGCADFSNSPSGAYGIDLINLD